jgi:sugar lactone lactonase YvrE
MLIPSIFLLGTIRCVLSAALQKPFFATKPQDHSRHASSFMSEAYNGDGMVATSAQLSYPYGVASASDVSGDLYIADTFNHRIRHVSAITGTITTVAGTGDFGFNGDDIAATAAQLNYPNGIVLDGLGNMYIADTNNHRIRRVLASTGIITTVAETGDFGFNGDDIAATAAELWYPSGIALDNSGEIAGSMYIADTNNHRIRYVSATSGIITTVAGSSNFGFSGDSMAATAAELWYPSGIAPDASGNLYIADTNNHRIRLVSAITGIITTVAGTGDFGFNGDDIAATAAQLNYPNGIVLDGLGNMFIADTYNHRIRLVSASSLLITTVAGTGDFGFSGDSMAATAAELWYPSGIAPDASGNLYIADTYNHRIRLVSAITGIITTVAGTDTTSPPPSALPTVEPTAVPSALPTVEPTSVPSAAPSAVPTAVPSAAPSAVPTSLPSAAPSVVPTSLPSAAPSVVPTSLPSGHQLSDHQQPYHLVFRHLSLLLHQVVFLLLHQVHHLQADKFLHSCRVLVLQLVHQVGYQRHPLVLHQVGYQHHPQVAPHQV